MRILLLGLLLLSGHALGEAVVVGFDSGYEVWVYRERPPEKEPAAKAELVLLFAPSGILAKTRVR